MPPVSVVAVLLVIETVVSVVAAVESESVAMAPPFAAELRVIDPLVIFSLALLGETPVPSTKNPPPSPDAWLPLIVPPVRVSVPPAIDTPPPLPAVEPEPPLAVLLVMLQVLFIVTAPPPK